MIHNCWNQEARDGCPRCSATEMRLKLEYCSLREQRGKVCGQPPGSLAAVYINFLRQMIQLSW